MIGGQQQEAPSHRKAWAPDSAIGAYHDLFARVAFAHGRAVASSDLLGRANDGGDKAILAGAVVDGGRGDG